MAKTKGNINIIHNSSKKLANNLILNRIKSHYQFKSDAQMARFLGLKTSAYANWHARGSINLELLITKCAELNPNWIINGDGRPTKSYDNLEESPMSLVHEQVEYEVMQKDELDRLQKMISAQEKTIAAQAKTIEVMEQLIRERHR